jgi:tyrosine-protein phosphatase SIW14
MSSRLINWIGGLTVIAIMVGIPVSYVHLKHKQSRNIRVVDSGILYRSGQLGPTGFKRLLHDYGIKTVISLRDSDDPSIPPPDRNEEEFCKGMHIKYVRITPRSWWPEYDGSPPAEKGVAKFLSVMDDPKNYPVLLHCFAGTHRTGAMVAIYRMEFNRWSNEDALAELRNAGYKNLDNEMDVLTYLQDYKPRIPPELR